MARFEVELPNDIIKELTELENNTEKMMGEMTTAAAEVTYKKIVSNMSGSFTPQAKRKLLKHLKITKTYKTPSDDGINNKVGFFGNIKTGKTYKRKNTYKKATGKTYESDGIPVDFVVTQREFGNSRGEQAIPFFRKSFNKREIEKAMLQVQGKYIPED